MDSSDKLSMSDLINWVNKEAENDPVFRQQIDNFLNKEPGQRNDPYSIFEKSLSEEERKIIENQRKNDPIDYVNDGLSISMINAQMKGLMDKVEVFQQNIDNIQLPQLSISTNEL